MVRAQTSLASSLRPLCLCGYYGRSRRPSGAATLYRRDPRRPVLHQWPADLRGAVLPGTPGRGAADDLADGPGDLRRPEPGDRFAVGLSGYREVGPGAEHAGVPGGDALLEGARP